MSPISLDLRYHAKTDTYYIQIRGEKYSRIDNKIRHINTRLKHIRGEQFLQERQELEKRRKRLLWEKRQAERYVQVHAADVPPNVSARPIYSLTGEIEAAEPMRYAQLLNRLRRNDHEN